MTTRRRSRRDRVRRNRERRWSRHFVSAFRRGFALGRIVQRTWSSPDGDAASVEPVIVRAWCRRFPWLTREEHLRPLLDRLGEMTSTQYGEEML